VPFAVLCHGAEVTVPAAFPVTRRVVRYPLGKADVVFAVSRYTTEKVARLAGRPVRTVGAGVDPAFAPAEHPVDGEVVGCVSRFVPRKGQRRLIEALATLRAEGRQVTGLFVGAGRDEAALRAMADRAGVPCRFEVRVSYGRLPGLYREMTVFAMPCRSRWFGLEAEGLGVVFLEAAATGLAVVAGDSGGAPETVDPGSTGFVVDTDAGLLEALRILLTDRPAAAEMGRRGRLRVLEKWSWGAVSRRYMEGLEAAVAGADQRPGTAERS
jgi:phosphatidylinositol alpha-1,6-mannosyltransferase